MHSWMLGCSFMFTLQLRWHLLEASLVSYSTELIVGKLFSFRDSVESWLKGHHQKVLLFDSDWILRTLSPSKESSKDLNLQESIYIQTIHKSSLIRCWFADIATLPTEMAVIAVDISIAYQSTGQWLAKLWVADRSRATRHERTNYHAQARTREDSTMHTCVTAYWTVMPPSHSNGSGQLWRWLDMVWTQLPRPRPPAWGLFRPYSHVNRLQTFMPKSHGWTVLILYL